MMRGRQIGNWIGNRHTAENAPQEFAVAEDRPSRNMLWRVGPAILLLLLILVVGWWVRREGGFRRFISSLRDGKVQSVEFQPYPNSAFVKITDEGGIAAVADWLGDAGPLDRYRYLGPTDCQMRIVMANRSVKRIWIGSTGPTRSGGTLVASNAYISLRGDGWERTGFSGGLCALYMKLPPAKQVPFSSVPLAPVPWMGRTNPSTAPANAGEVDASVALSLLESNEPGAARRVLARALALNPNDGSAQQFMQDTQARIRIRLPLTLKELENQLPGNGPKLDREKYLQLREKLMDVTLMAEAGDAKVAELRKRLSEKRPDARVENFKEVLRLGGAAPERYAIRDFAWSPDGATIATCGDDGRVRIWDTIHGELLASFPASVGNKIYFSEDGQKVCVANDRARTWWDAISGKPAAEAKWVGDMKNQRYHVDLTDSDVVIFYAAKDPKTRQSLVGHAGAVKLARLSADEDELATFGEDKVLSIWGDSTPRGIVELSPFERLRRIGGLAGPSVFLEDGSILTFASEPKTPLQNLGQFKFSLIDLGAEARHATFAARAQRLLVEMENGKIAVVQPNEKKVYPIEKPEGSSGRPAISADGKTVAIGNLDGSVVLMNVETGEPVAKFSCTPTRNRKWAAVEISADSGWVMACGIGFVSVWNMQTREQVFYSEKAAGDGIAASFTPDGKGLGIIYKDGGLRVLKSNLRESEAVGWDQQAMRNPIFSRDGRYLAAIAKTGEVAIYDSNATAIAYVAVKVSTTAPDALAFNQDGSILLIKTDDGSLRIMESPGGRELRRLMVRDQPNGLRFPVSFNPDGKYLIAGPMLWGDQ
jgi:WD40 repeat protein